MGSEFASGSLGTGNHGNSKEVDLFGITMDNLTVNCCYYLVKCKFALITLLPVLSKGRPHLTMNKYSKPGNRTLDHVRRVKFSSSWRCSTEKSTGASDSGDTDCTIPSSLRKLCGQKDSIRNLVNMIEMAIWSFFTN